MTDHELLMMAAKAVGLLEMAVGDNDIKRYLSRWNPLTDDGDALRLACDLGLRVYPIARTSTGAACSAVGSVTSERLAEVMDASLNTRAATRRAIVRAAAEIGRSME